MKPISSHCFKGMLLQTIQTLTKTISAAAVRSSLYSSLISWRLQFTVCSSLHTMGQFNAKSHETQTHNEHPLLHNLKTLILLVEGLLVCGAREFICSALQDRDILMHLEMDQSLVSLHSRVMCSHHRDPHNWRIYVLELHHANVHHVFPILVCWTFIILRFTGVM
jgi:hypothetical protein